MRLAGRFIGAVRGKPKPAEAAVGASAAQAISVKEARKPSYRLFGRKAQKKTVQAVKLERFSLVAAM